MCLCLVTRNEHAQSYAQSRKDKNELMKAISEPRHNSRLPITGCLDDFRGKKITWCFLLGFFFYYLSRFYQKFEKTNFF